MKLKLIKDKKKIDKIFDEGKRVGEGVLYVKFYDFEDSCDDYGISVPKKNFPLAVTRNRIKRRVRNSVSNLIKKKLKFGHSFFVVISSTTEPSYKTINSSLSVVFEKL